MSRVHAGSGRLNKGWGPLSPPIVSVILLHCLFAAPIMRLYSWSCAGCQAAKRQRSSFVLRFTLPSRFEVLMMTERRCLNGIARSS